MKEKWMTCPMCGHSFDPGQHTACQACPLQSGCQLVCCPACGYELVDVQKSTLAQWVARTFFSNRTKTDTKQAENGGA